MMKLSWILALSLTMVATVSRAETREDSFDVSQASGPHVLFSNVESGYYVAPMMRVGDVAGNQQIFAGMRGGWIVNHGFVLGLSLGGLATHYPIPGDRLSFAYGGALLEYILSSDSLFHVSVSTMIGGGAVAPKSSSSPQGVFVATPEADLFVNLSQSIRAGVGLDYRFTRGVSIAHLNNSDLSGMGGNFLVQFGSF
jgi:hypothetical protein